MNDKITLEDFLKGTSDFILEPYTVNAKPSNSELTVQNLIKVYNKCKGNEKRKHLLILDGGKDTAEPIARDALEDV